MNNVHPLVTNTSTRANLSSSIPKSQVDGTTVDHDVGAVVIEHSGHVLPREGVRRVGDEETGLTDRAVSHNYTLDVLHG